MGVIYYQELLAKAAEERAKYFDNFFEILRAVGSSQPNVKKIGDHIFLIHFSDLVGKPWNVNYHSWGASAESIIDYARKKEYPSDFIDYLKKCRKKAKNGTAKIGDNKNQFIVQTEFLDRVLDEVRQQGCKVCASEQEKQKYVYIVFEHQSITEFHCETRLLCVTDKYPKAMGIKKGYEDGLADCLKKEIWYEVVKEEVI